MGKAAGTKAIGVTWGHHDPHELLAAGADILVETYADLPLAIKKVLED
jgi:phosphoglycolate phosphatase